MKLTAKLFFFLLTFVSLVFAFETSTQAGHCHVSYQNSGCSWIYTGGCDGSDPSDPNCSQCSGGGTAGDGMVCATSPNSCNWGSCTASNTITRCSGGSCSNSSNEGHPWSVCSDSTASCTQTACPAQSCSDNLNYCDAASGRTIHKHGGVWNTTNCSCTYAFDDVGSCAPGAVPVAPVPGSPSAPAPGPMCPIPTQVQNIRVDCPYCGASSGPQIQGNPSISPNDIPANVERRITFSAIGADGTGTEEITVWIQQGGNLTALGSTRANDDTNPAWQDSAPVTLPAGTYQIVFIPTTSNLIQGERKYAQLTVR